MGTEPDKPTLKKLFALTRNVCSFQSLDDGRGCEVELARPTWPWTQGEVAHIRGAKPGSARYEAAMSDAERRAFENLIVLCPTHHHFVDEIERDRYTPEVLTAMKDRHESNAGYAWASDAELDRYAALVLVHQFGLEIIDIREGEVKEIDGVPIEQVATVDGVPIEDVATVNGVPIGNVRRPAGMSAAVARSAQRR